MIRLLAHARRCPLIPAVTFILIVLLPLPLWADDGPLSRATLQGIKAVRVVVVLHPDEITKDGLTEDQLRTDVELRLRKAGVAVNSSTEERLWIMVAAHSFGGESVVRSYSFSLTAKLVQGVALTRDPGIVAWGDTWSAWGVGTVSATQFSRYLRDMVGDHVDRFINAYLEQNPKR